MKKRIAISNISVLIIVAVSKPDSTFLFFIGLLIVLLGQAIRLVASATIIKSKTLTVKGIYSVCRNPLYLGTLTMVFGMGIQLYSSNTSRLIASWLIILLVFPYIYYKTIKAEEKFLLSIYEKDFEKYLESTPCIIPNFSAIKNIFDTSIYNISVFKKNKEYRGFAGMVLIETIIAVKLIYGF